MSKLSMMVGSRIKKYRLQRKMTQNDMAEKLNISMTTISRYESGERQPSSDILVRICSILNISVNQLFYEETSNTRPSDNTRSIPVIKYIDRNKPFTAKENIINYLSLPLDFLPSDDCFLIKAEDDSMAPIINKDAYVLIHPQVRIEEGAIGAILCEDETKVALKKVRFINDSILIESLNDNYDPLIIDKNTRPPFIGQAINVWNPL